MAKKKSVFEKLGLIEQIDEDIEEIQETESSSLFEPRDVAIKEEIFEDEDEMIITREALDEESLYEKDFSNDLFERAANSENEKTEEKIEINETESIEETLNIEKENELFENVKTVDGNELFKMSNNREETQIEDIDPFEQMAKNEAIKKEKERIQREIAEYEEITQGFKKTINEDELLKVDEIYEQKSLNYDKKKTIFMVDEFINALPDSLPMDVKRESVKNIITASGIDLENLMEDAYKRLDTLNKEMDMQLNATNKIITDSNIAIAELESKILEIKKQINERKKRQDESKHGIEYETQRIINIVEFINPPR